MSSNRTENIYETISTRVGTLYSNQISNSNISSGGYDTPISYYSLPDNNHTNDRYARILSKSKKKTKRRIIIAVAASSILILLIVIGIAVFLGINFIGK